MSGQKNDGGSGGQAGAEKRRRQNPEEIIGKVREIDADLGAGQHDGELAAKQPTALIRGHIRMRCVARSLSGRGVPIVGS